MWPAPTSTTRPRAPTHAHAHMHTRTCMRQVWLAPSPPRAAGSSPIVLPVATRASSCGCLQLTRCLLASSHAHAHVTRCLLASSLVHAHVHALNCTHSWRHAWWCLLQVGACCRLHFGNPLLVWYHLRTHARAEPWYAHTHAHVQSPSGVVPSPHPRSS